MEEVREEVAPAQTAVMVVYDHDHTKSKRHSLGVLFQCPFEDPWARNIRIYACFQQHIRLLQASENPKVILGVATFGEYRDRIEGSWGALGVAKDSILICAKFVKKRVAKIQGKNLHIAMLLKEHYQRNPSVKITKVYLLDDDGINIQATDNYSYFVRAEPWNSDPRLDVPVEGILVPKPELVMQPTKSLFAPSPDPQTRFDQCLNMEVDKEDPRTEWQFLRILKLLEQKLGIENNGINFRLFEHRKSSEKDQLRQVATRKLARSFDSPGFLKPKPEPLSEVMNLNQSADNWNVSASSLVSEDEEDENSKEFAKLFKSV